MYLALSAAAVCAFVAVRRDRRAWPALGLPVLPAVPCVLATLGWSLSSLADRTASWVPVSALVCLALWLPLMAAPLSRASRQWLLVSGAGVLSAPALLLSCAVAAMSGSGDWI